MGPITIRTKREAFCLDDPSDYMMIDSSSLFSTNLNMSDQESMSSDDTPLAREDGADLDVLAGLGDFQGGRRAARDESYLRRRQRNNAAVRRSREKARERQRDSAKRLAELTAENSRLQMKASVLLKELSLLRGLFPGETGHLDNPQLMAEVDSILNTQ